MTAKRGDIPGYFNEYYDSAVKIYNDWKRHGYPWAGGYMELPAYLKDIYDLFDITLDKYRTK